MKQNPKREPSSNPNAILELFQNKKLILGETHDAAPNKGHAPCGPNCPHRLTSISCPFFTPTTPCLVGCNVKQIIEIPGSIGQTYHREIAIFVTSQAGMILIGEEQIINLQNPFSAHTRIVTNKHGQQVTAGDHHGEESFFGLDDGQPMIVSGTLPDENSKDEVKEFVEKNTVENKDAKS